MITAGYSNTKGINNLRHLIIMIILIITIMAIFDKLCRFGKLCWRKVPGSELSTEMYTPENFVRQAFESAASYFSTR